MTNSSWQPLIDEYIEELRTVRQLSPHTLSNYRRDLQKFIQFCQQQQLEDPIQVHNSDVRHWAASQHRQGLSGRSIQRALSALRSFYKFRNRLGGKHNPAIDVQAPKSPRKLPKALDTDSMQQLLNIDNDDWLSCRDSAIMELFYSSGLRLSELVDLNLGDMDLADGQLTVTGKGNKTRQLPIGRFAIDALHLWLAQRQLLTVKNDDAPAVFISQRGKRLGQRAIQLRLKKYSLQQGLGQNIHPHMLRHSFASHMLESSSDLRAVQELLGHANISTTQVYTHLDFQHLAKVYDKAHPRAQQKKNAHKKK